MPMPLPARRSGLGCWRSALARSMRPPAATMATIIIITMLIGGTIETRTISRPCPESYGDGAVLDRHSVAAGCSQAVRLWSVAGAELRKGDRPSAVGSAMRRLLVATVTAVSREPPASGSGPISDCSGGGLRHAVDVTRSRHRRQSLRLALGEPGPAGPQDFRQQRKLLHFLLGRLCTVATDEPY